MAAANGDTLLRSAIGYQQYSLETVDSMQIEPTNLHARAVPFIGGAIGAGTALVSGLLLTRVLARQREESAPVKVAVPQGLVTLRSGKPVVLVEMSPSGGLFHPQSNWVTPRARGESVEL